MQPAYVDANNLQNYKIQDIVALLEEAATALDKVAEKTAKARQEIMSDVRRYEMEMVSHIASALSANNLEAYNRLMDETSETLTLKHLRAEDMGIMTRVSKTSSKHLDPFIKLLKPFSNYTFLELGYKIGAEKRSHTQLNEELAGLRRSRETVTIFKDGACCDIEHTRDELEKGELPGVGCPLKLLREKMIEETNSSVSNIKKNSHVINPVKEAGKKWCELLTPEVVEAVSKRAGSKLFPIDKKILRGWRKLAMAVTDRSIYGRKEETYAGIIKTFEEALKEKEKEIGVMEGVLEISDVVYSFIPSGLK
jgi:hypothetical protein